MKKILFTTSALAAILAAHTAAASIQYYVTVDTTALVGNPSGPFSLDFQLNDGSGTGDANNTAIVNNFTFGGGSPLAGPTWSGGASGDLSTAVLITDSSAFNEFYQPFSAGGTVSFNVTLSSSNDAGPTPDAFSFAILDTSLYNIPTTGVGDTMMMVNLGSNPSLITGMATSPVATITVVPVPEPAPYVFLILGVAAIAMCKRLDLSVRG